MAEKPEKKEIFYVGLKDPTEVRRNLLEASRDIVVFLKTYENFKRVRVQKIQEIEKLKLSIQEVTRILNKLRRELPKTRLREKPEEVIKKGGKRKIMVPRKATAENEIERLESELSAIESKLKLL
jgi:uncharacterized protein YfkK (UPF0435 family)